MGRKDSLQQEETSSHAQQIALLQEKEKKALYRGEIQSLVIANE